METEHRGRTILVSAAGDLDESAAPALQGALDDNVSGAQALMIDLHGVAAMNRAGLLHLLELHRRGECLGLRVLVIGWQPQPRQLLAETAGITGPDSATERRHALAGFRHLITQRAQCAQNIAATTTAETLPRR
ncbi:STAS domain-containing protein [Streptomyces avidinii]|uniref:STAS domain-containing protein n=1 Tax=Streptomyces avidinii TaxID=1895 RepID=UPI001E5F1723|nr:STAS domain-containing protein [Streptomyces avidinii]